MNWKWLIVFICGSIFQNCTAEKVVTSRRFENRLAELLSGRVEADGASRSTFDADPHLNALTIYDRSEIGDANPMCHVVTLRRRLESLSNVAGNIDCMRSIVFEDCCQPFFLSLRTSGIYPIKAGRKGYAYCDQETDGGGWVVVARRAGGGRSFDKTWRQYKKGFGPLDKDFWLGLDSLSYLTNPLLSAELRFDMRHLNGTWFYAYYSHIEVAPEEENYRLTVRGYDPDRSNIYDSFSVYDQVPFSTKDRHNLAFSRICSNMLNDSGAGWWWYDRGLCLTVNMHFPYYLYARDGEKVAKGIYWINENATVDTQLNFIEMKVRPKLWRCGNRPHFYWEYIQDAFLNREDEEEEEEQPIVAPTTTTSPSYLATTDPSTLPPTHIPETLPRIIASALPRLPVTQPPPTTMPAPTPATAA